MCPWLQFQNQKLWGWWMVMTMPVPLPYCVSCDCVRSRAWLVFQKIRQAEFRKRAVNVVCNVMSDATAICPETLGPGSRQDNSQRTTQYISLAPFFQVRPLRTVDGTYAHLVVPRVRAHTMCVPIHGASSYSWPSRLTLAWHVWATLQFRRQCPPRCRGSAARAS